MLSIFQSLLKPQEQKDLPLKSYLVDITLDGLAFGVDNIRIDVRISPQISTTLEKAAWGVIIKHSHADFYFPDYKRDVCESEKDHLKNLCADVLQDAIDRAKIKGEHRIDYLGQVALSKMFLEEVKSQFRNLVTFFEQQINSYQLSSRQADHEEFKARKKLVEIKLNQNRIIRKAGEELFSLLMDIQTKNLREMRETHFRPEQILPDVFFDNPVLHTANPSDDSFLIDEYVLLGRRASDPDTYDNVLAILYSLMAKAGFSGRGETPPPTDGRDDGGNIYDQWIMESGNIDLMFNVFDTKEQFEREKKSKGSADRLRELRGVIKYRQRLLDFFYGAFKKAGLIKLIVAAIEMKALSGVYCPPMEPRLIKEFLANIWSRRSIARQLEHRRSVYRDELALGPLKQAVHRIRHTSALEKKLHVFNFLKTFSRYHRDRYNARILNESMAAVNLVTDEKIMQLSRGNRSLYEFLLPAERIQDENPVINHVIIKADIRGSININNSMRARGLNPASHFSLNFFDPISEILWNYEAVKVFIEGDAIILSIFEKEDIPQGWYSVARACGLAMRILQIVQRYNIKNQENNLPILELGIGICYSPEPPSYLFDGNSPIMISPAINMADRLSSCSRNLRSRLTDRNPLYNLYVFKNSREDDDETDDHSLRYNVNGIELSEEAFAKLSREIKLTRTTFKAPYGEDIHLHTGKVPTISGTFQMLAIRESLVCEADPETLAVIRATSRKYYEVCTNQIIHDHIASLSDPN
ncbi:MAG: hypothetical protein EG826_11780 [Deltaproteobacteria bacterium]|nr:hypothetical protein [Deltaproteobacteria bacterium]